MFKRNKNRLINLLFPFALIMLTLSITLFVFSSNSVGDTTNTTNKERENEHVEFIKDMTLESVNKDQACFIEKVPNYVYGRTGDNCVDINYFNKSEFENGNKFKLLRIYTRGNSGEYKHEYTFSRVIGKVN